MQRNSYDTILDRFYHWEEATPNNVFLRQPTGSEWKEWTFDEAGGEIRKMAQYLKDQGLQKGDRVALVSKNCSYWIMADLAILMAGGVSVPLFPNQQAENISFCIDHCQAKIAFTGRIDDPSPLDEGIPAHVKTIGMEFPEGYTDTYKAQVSWQDAMKSSIPLAGKPQVDQDDMASIIYTSGTTGRPKGVVHTYRGFGFAASTGSQYFNMTSDDRFISFLPLSHVAERVMVEYNSIYCGCSISFVQSLDTFAANVKAVAPTLFFAVPRIWKKFQLGILDKMPQQKLDRLLRVPLLSQLIKYKIRSGLGLHKARLIISGAAPIAPSLIEWFDRLGVTIQEGYGQTENIAYGTLNPKDDIEVGSVGKPMPSNQIKIGDDGEILIKNDAVMSGYYLEPDKTAETMEDGYILTGDVGHLGPRGHLYITGRVKEIFKTDKGKYVAPAPIESLISQNDAVEQICVMGTGMVQPVALVVLSEAARKRDRKDISKEFSSMVQKVNQSLDHHEKIEKVLVCKEEWTVETGLMTPTLKVKRNQVEKKYRPMIDNPAVEDSVIFEN